MSRTAFLVYTSAIRQHRILLKLWASLGHAQAGQAQDSATGPAHSGIYATFDYQSAHQGFHSYDYCFSSTAHAL